MRYIVLGPPSFQYHTQLLVLELSLFLIMMTSIIFFLSILAEIYFIVVLAIDEKSVAFYSFSTSLFLIINCNFVLCRRQIILSYVIPFSLLVLSQYIIKYTVRHIVNCQILLCVIVV